MFGLQEPAPNDHRSMDPRDVPGGDEGPPMDAHEEATLETRLDEGAAETPTDRGDETPACEAPGLDSTMVGPPEIQPPLVPRRLGPFVLIELLGRGKQA